MSDELDDMLKRSRRVYRATRSEGEEPGVPPGFAERVQKNRRAGKSPALVMWERVSYLGTACALAIGMATFWSAKEHAEAVATDLWMEMPMISNPGGGPAR